MDWLNKRHDFSEADLKQFHFRASKDFSATTVRIERATGGGTSCKTEKIQNENDYVKWLKQVEASPPDSCASIVLVIHPRLTGDDTVSPPEVMSLHQTKDTFRLAVERLFQHRSICDIVCRISTAIFSSRKALWGSNNTYGPSIIYNCRSDTQSPGGEDDIAMSVTWFPEAQKTFGVIYGSLPRTSRHVGSFSKKIQESNTALHPLLLPMMFAELERKRLLNSFDQKKSEIYQRILDMERSLDIRVMGKEDSNVAEEKDRIEDPSDGRETTQLWMDASSLRTGLESLKFQLGRMMEHSKWLSGRYFPAGGTGAYAEEREVGEMIESRLQEIMAECDSKARSFDTLLGGMGLATQMEWNYHSRSDAKATHFITSQAKKDSGQMKFIARLGMIFLPPTFLASFFSMGFFKWIPENSKQIVSPYIVQRYTSSIFAMQNLKAVFVAPGPQAQVSKPAFQRLAMHGNIIRKCNASMRTSARKIDREIAHMKQQEAKTKNLILQADRRASRDTQRRAQALRDVRTFGGELVRYRKTSARLVTSKAQLNSIQMQVNESLAVSKIEGGIRASASVMRDVNSLIHLPELAGIMQDLSKELMKAGIIEEMVGEALPEEGFAEFEEAADEAEVDKVLGEILKTHVATAEKLPTTLAPVKPVITTHDQEDEEDGTKEMMDQMRAKLDALRS